MGRRGSKIDDNGMKWHHFLVKKLMVTSFLVKNITFEQFLNVFEKSLKNKKSNFQNCQIFHLPRSKIENLDFLTFFDIFAYMEVWR